VLRRTGHLGDLIETRSCVRHLVYTSLFCCVRIHHANCEARETRSHATSACDIRHGCLPCSGSP